MQYVECSKSMFDLMLAITPAFNNKAVAGHADYLTFTAALIADMFISRHGLCFFIKDGCVLL